MALTQYLVPRLADHVLGISSFTMPAQLWGALLLSSPGFVGSTAGEISVDATGYGRVNLAGKMGAADLTTGLSRSSEVINIGPALVDWGTITYFALMTAETGGDMLAYAELSESETIYAEGQFQRVPGQLTFRLF